MFYIKEQYATIWKIEDKGKYSLVQLSTARKDKSVTPEVWVNSNWSFVKFVGKAHDKVQSLNEKDRIVIMFGGISKESYMSEGVKKYPKNPSIVVFDFIMADEYKSNKEQEESEELPFD